MSGKYRRRRREANIVDPNDPAPFAGASLGTGTYDRHLRRPLARPSGQTLGTSTSRAGRWGQAHTADRVRHVLSAQHSGIVASRQPPPMGIGTSFSAVGAGNGKGSAQWVARCRVARCLSPVGYPCGRLGTGTCASNATIAPSIYCDFFSGACPQLKTPDGASSLGRARNS